MTPNSRQIQIEIEGATKNVVVYELTMSQMRALLQSRATLEQAAENEETPLTAVLDILTTREGVLLPDLQHLTDLTPSDIDALTESHLDEILAASKELNPRFFGQILSPLRRVAEAMGAPAKPSSTTSSSSSEPATEMPGTTQ